MNLTTNPPKSATCIECANTFTTPDEWCFAFPPERCDSCEERARQDADAERERQHWAMLQQAREAAGHEVLAATPARFAATDIGHANFRGDIWGRVKGWRPTDERPWLGLIGPTGACKTRCSFLLLRELVTAGIDQKTGSRPSFAAVSHTTLARWIVGQHDDRPVQSSVLAGRGCTVGDEAKDHLLRVRAADILLLDDLGKAKATPAVSSWIFDLLDHRHAENLPTIWTANGAPERIVAGMPEDMAAPLAGRLIECSTILSIQ